MWRVKIIERDGFEKLDVRNPSVKMHVVVVPESVLKKQKATKDVDVDGELSNSRP